MIGHKVITGFLERPFSRVCMANPGFFPKKQESVVFPGFSFSQKG
jgi:hypothetical protein